jgi:hypothetical protein
MPLKLLIKTQYKTFKAGTFCLGKCVEDCSNYFTVHKSKVLSDSVKQSKEGMIYEVLKNGPKHQQIRITKINRRWGGGRGVGFSAKDNVKVMGR